MIKTNEFSTIFDFQKQSALSECDVFTCSECSFVQADQNAAALVELGEAKDTLSLPPCFPCSCSCSSARESLHSVAWNLKSKQECCSSNPYHSLPDINLIISFETSYIYANKVTNFGLFSHS